MPLLVHQKIKWISAQLSAAIFAWPIFLAAAETNLDSALSTNSLPPAATRKIDFVKDIQPILKNNCYSCHGAEKQKGELRWDVKSLALKGGEHGAEILPGKSAASRMIQLVSGLNPDLIMPQKGERLTSEQIGILRAWIDQGAIWPDGVDLVKYVDKKDHWAFKAPVSPPIPKTKNLQWIRNPIDAFVLAKMEQEKLHPSPEANRLTLIRRLSLDLIGLPPTLKEVDDFIADQSADAYKKLVERLLASPHYGEKWGRHWLDAARYADTNGYEKDLPRNIWPYRDWVINAFNRDLPFDEFTIDQIAGDLLPNATIETKTATGFLRNSMLNEEGGIDPEQFRIEGIIDRMDAMSKAFLGLTVACAQCHNHKFDPISQKEYYQLFAFLNNDDEPEMEVPDKNQKKKRAAIQKKIAELEDELMAKNSDVPARMSEWESRMRDIAHDWTVLEPAAFYGAVGTKFIKQKDHSLLALGSSPPNSAYAVSVKTTLTNITGFRLETLTDPNLPSFGPGRSKNGNFVLSEFKVEAAPTDLLQTNQITFTNATADFSQKDFPVSAAIDGMTTNKTGWGGEDLPGRRNRNHVAVFETKTNIGFAGGTILNFTLHQDFGGEHTIGRFRLSAITEKRSLQADPLSKTQREILAVPMEKRSKEQQRQLFSAYRLTDVRFAETTKKIDEEQAKWPEAAKTLVLMNRAEPRETHIFKRGDFHKPGDLVAPATPAILPPLPKTESPNRLTLAKWLADKKNPLMARVIVNRIWQNYFGQGLVTTPEDFGTRCDGASHPELLDWLATQFMGKNWSIKEMHRLIVRSATYRQSSKIAPEIYAIDQYNRWLERGPRFRVEGELVRDIALSASGLLSHKIGGPSVYPPIPDGVLSLGYGAPMKWETSVGEDRYRRGLYTFWKRSVPYPGLSIFDAPNADFSCVRRIRSNTPLQSLTTLNDTVFHECSQALALRVFKEGGTNDNSRATFAFRLCTGRAPDEIELKQTLSLLDDQQKYFDERTDKALAVALADPKNIPADVNLHKVAAWTMVSRVLLNMDETITKE
ncbi:MAG: PSD1 and planctomycete cytochrome C domain-containing protein [Limisphaerales bacterium]